MAAVDVRSFSLRAATPDDVEFLASTFLVSLREAIEAARGGWDERREREQFERQLEFRHTQIICLGGIDIGFLTSIPRDTEVELHTLCIAPEYQSQGIGSHVTRQLAQSAHAAGQCVVLSVLKSNPRAFRLYERMGFVQVGESQYHVRLELRVGTAASRAD